MSNPTATDACLLSRFCVLTGSLGGPERLALFFLLDAKVRAAAWDDLARRIDRERWGR